MRLAVMGPQKLPKKTASLPLLGTTWNLVETKAHIDQITKWYVTEILSAALPLTEAPKVWVVTSQKYASVPFLDTTQNLVRTKAYIALIAKKFVSEFCFGCFTPAETSKVWIVTVRVSENILTENRMKRSVNKSLHCTDYEMQERIQKVLGGDEILN